MKAGDERSQSINITYYIQVEKKYIQAKYGVVRNVGDAKYHINSKILQNTLIMVLNKPS